MAQVLAIDVGGTFTDLVLVEPESGRIRTAKTPTTKDPADAVLAGMKKILRSSDAQSAELRSLEYATTAAVNTLLTRSGARVGLLTTEGTRQVLHLARSQTPGPLVGWLNMTKPEPLADLSDTREIRERMRADGSIETVLDEEQVLAVVRDLVDQGIESLAIGFLHSYANPKHEERAATLAKRAGVNIPVTTSSAIHPEYREYERIGTAVANAYVMPSVSRHLADIRQRLRSERYDCTVNVVRSDGGLMSVESACERPVATIFSGPSGGVAGALAYARAAGFESVLTLDMGGTSTDVALCVGGEPAITRETEVAGLPIRSASIDVRSVGAGGGSIAHVGELVRALRVGPQSAGAEPGPACYGRGGTEATVTDANLVLGRIPAIELGGELPVDRAAAEAAVGALAGKLELDPLSAAEGIIAIVNENMAGPLRVMSVERGLDPRTLPLVAFGGAGPLHANALAQLIGCYPVLVPPSPGVLSAFGFHTVGARNIFARTLVTPLTSDHWVEIKQVLDVLTAGAKRWLQDEGVNHGWLSYSCDLRFLRQGYEIEISFDEDDLTNEWPRLIAERFRNTHKRLYGFATDTTIELVSLRVEGRGQPTIASLPTHTPSTDEGSGAFRETAQVCFQGRFYKTGVYDRTALRPGDELPGPAVLVQDDATTLVLPHHKALVNQQLALEIMPTHTQ